LQPDSNGLAEAPIPKKPVLRLCVKLRTASIQRRLLHMLEVVPLPLNLIASKEKFARSAARHRKVFSKRRAGGTRESLFTLELLRLLASQSSDGKRHGEKEENRLAGDHVDIDTEDRNSERIVVKCELGKKMLSNSGWPVTVPLT
jgi:hypothetical protein